jgi:hypothetical protein
MFSLSLRDVFGKLGTGLIVLATLCADFALGADAPTPDRRLLRYDPVISALVPLAESEARAGCVYSHYSERLRRRVWAICQPDGGFSNALGVGTTQSSRALDIRESIEAKVARLEQVDKELAQRVGLSGMVYFCLGADDRWQLDRNSTRPTVYDLETMFRWEWGVNGYVRVSSAPFAYRWQVVDGRYVALPGAQVTGGDALFCGCL